MAEPVRGKPGRQGPAAADEKTELIRRAVLRRQPLVAVYRGRTLRMYPHALGWREGKQLVLAFVPGRCADKTQRAASPWEWISLRDLRSVAVQEGQWRTADHPPPDGLDLIEAVGQ